MSVRPGTPIVTSFGSVTLGSAGGRTLTIGGAIPPYVLTAISLSYVATATVGNRVPTITVRDGNGNILWIGTAIGNITAGQTARVLAGAGVTPQSVTTGSIPSQIFSLPVELGIPFSPAPLTPALPSIIVADNANIDVNDTFSGNITIAC